MNYKNIITLAAALSIGFPALSVASSHQIPATMQQMQSEGRVLGLLMVLNKNEIAAGHLAMTKSANHDVKQYATFMVNQHTKNLNATEALSNKLGIKAIEDKAALKLQAKGKKELASLNKLDGMSFDKAYINAMVKGHKDALNLVNHLISNTSNSMIKKHLEATKVHVEHHLQKAEMIKKSFK